MKQKMQPKAGGGKKRGLKKAGKRTVWERIPGDVLCRILEMAPPKEMYRSRLVCKHWNACWKGHDWPAVLQRQGPWVLLRRNSGTLSGQAQEVWCPKTGARFEFSTPGGGYVQLCDNTSQGLVLGHIPETGMFIGNPLSPGDNKFVPCDKFEDQQPQLLVEDAAKGIYKVAFATQNSTDVYDSVTGAWQSFQTAQEFLSHGLVTKACVLASRHDHNLHPFTSPSSYLMQFMVDDSKRGCGTVDGTQVELAWKQDEASSRAYPTERDARNRPFIVFHTAGRCIGVLLKPHYFVQRPFMEVVVYELDQAAVDDTVVWKRLGATQLLKDVEDWTSCAHILHASNISVMCVENLLALQMNRPFCMDLDKYSVRESKLMQPVVFDLENRTWTSLEHIKDEFDRSISSIFKPNPLARARTVCTHTYLC